MGSFLGAPIITLGRCVNTCAEDAREQQKPTSAAFRACGHISRQGRNVAENDQKITENRVFGWEAVSTDFSIMEQKTRTRSSRSSKTQ